ncbi:MAG: Hsp70 family protein [Planctomycetales bacterium]|nr:Hsp70 family protein [Planctomycetales bacterium]
MTFISRTPVGIDLGTTFSAIARLDENGRPTTLVNAEGDLITPSVVLFEGANVVVGKEALKAIATEADDVADCAKRELGNATFHKALGGRDYPPEVIQAFILHKLRRDAHALVGEVRQAVVTVPAYFDEVRRKATQDAGYMAGIEVLDIINEPTAAAIAYGAAHGFLTPEGVAQRPQTILVYDLGGGTFDVTIMRIEGAEFMTLATDGDVQLGGRDWDARLMDFAAAEFIGAHGVDPREEANSLGRLWRECEDCKRTLSARLKTTIGCDYKGHALRVEITREQFEAMTRDLLDRTRFTTQQTLQAAGLEWSSIDQLLMVGGSTRMPMVAEMLGELCGRAPDASVSADEVVAHGAALRAGLILTQRSGQRGAFQIKNVNSHSLGVVAIDPLTKRKLNATLIPRNTPLPVAAKRIFKTQKEGQKSVLVQIVEGESSAPEHCVQLGRCVIRDLPVKLPANTPIDVRFRYEENGRLGIQVSVGNTGKFVEASLVRENSLSQEQLDVWRRYITGGETAREEDSASGRWK